MCLLIYWQGRNTFSTKDLLYALYADNLKELYEDGPRSKYIGKLTAQPHLFIYLTVAPYMTPWAIVISLIKEHKVSQSETISQDKLISFFFKRCRDCLWHCHILPRDIHYIVGISSLVMSANLLEAEISLNQTVIKGIKVLFLVPKSSLIG